MTLQFEGKNTHTHTLILYASWFPNQSNKDDADGADDDDERDDSVLYNWILVYTKSKRKHIQLLRSNGVAWITVGIIVFLSMFDVIFSVLFLFLACLPVCLLASHKIQFFKNKLTYSQPSSKPRHHSSGPFVSWDKREKSECTLSLNRYIYIQSATKTYSVILSHVGVNKNEWLLLNWNT